MGVVWFWSKVVAWSMFRPKEGVLVGELGIFL